MATETCAISSSFDQGLLMNPCALPLKAARAMSIEPNAVIRMIERFGSRRRISRRSSRPLRSGRLTSSSIKSNGRSSSLCNPASPVSAGVTSKPSDVRRASRPSRISISSSTTSMDPLGMNRFSCYGKFEPERRSFSRRRAHVNLARMLLYDAVAHRKTQAGAPTGGLCCEKWIENAMEMLGRNAGARVGDLNFHRTVVGARADFQHATAGHRIARVHEEIQKHLL